MTTVTISKFQLTNHMRAEQWQGEAAKWSGLELAGAMCGEAGEAANIAKKLRRMEQGIAGNKEGETYDGLVKALGVELADLLAYACLLASHYGVDLERVAIEKFNAVSLARGFPHRL